MDEFDLKTKVKGPYWPIWKLRDELDLQLKVEGPKCLFFFEKTIM
jgi:hypothetical protein